MQDIETYDTIRRATQRIGVGRARIPPSRPSQLQHEPTLVIKCPSGNGQVNEEGPHSRPSRPATESTPSPSASETNEAITMDYTDDLSLIFQRNWLRNWDEKLKQKIPEISQLSTRVKDMNAFLDDEIRNITEYRNEIRNIIEHHTKIRNATHLEGLKDFLLNPNILSSPRQIVLDSMSFGELLNALLDCMKKQMNEVGNLRNLYLPSDYSMSEQEQMMMKRLLQSVLTMLHEEEGIIQHFKTQRYF